MPVHKSAVKRVRQSAKRRDHNRTRRSTMRTLIRKTLASTNKEEAEVLFKEASSFLDRVAAKRIIHKNKAAHQKARLAKHVNSL